MTDRIRRTAATVALVTVAALGSSCGGHSEAPAAQASAAPRPAKQPAITTSTDAPPPMPNRFRLFGGDTTPPLAIRHVTRDQGTDRYRLHQDGTGLIVDAPRQNLSTPAGSATRAVIWPPSSTAVLDATTCATWARSAPWGQEGLAVRVRTDGDRFRAIVIAKNTVFGASWQFNVYSWDSERDPYFQIHGAVDLGDAFGAGPRPRRLPWRVCARTRGATVEVKGWPEGEPEPRWGAPGHSGSVEIPGWLTYPGKAGWYAGHIEPGDLIALDDLEAFATPSGP